MQEAWIGIDVGTSSVKCLALNTAGSVIASSQSHYAISRPHPGWAEQNPGDWWSALCLATRSLMNELGYHSIRAVGLSGQMHGLVLVDAQHRVVRPAIIWADGRGETEVREWRDSIGDDDVEATTGFRSASGIAGISLAWLSKHEPQALARTAFCMQAKDYVRLRLTGQAGLDPTDAGASLLFDLDTMTPAPALLSAAGITDAMIPPVLSTLGAAGVVTNRSADSTGLPSGVVVATGGSDQAMTALGLGLTTPDRVAIALGSGGTVLVPLAPDKVVPTGYHRLRTAHPRSQLAMGVVLAAGLATDWLAKMVGQPAAQVLDQAAGAHMDEGLMALPDLGGTRTPRVDIRPQGAFAGIDFHHRPPHLMRALVESVAVSLTDALAELQPVGAGACEIVVSGGGARFGVWRQAVADAAGMPVVQSADVEHAALGAALAGAAAEGTEITFDPQRRVKGTSEPDPDTRERLLGVRTRRAELLAACLPSYGSTNPRGEHD